MEQWRIIASSVRGVSHEKSGLPCQDANASRTLPGGILIAAVADGAGSAVHADIGAAVAAQSAIEALEEADIASLKTEAGLESGFLSIFQYVRTKLEAEARHMQVDVRFLATTLILAVAWQDGVAVGQIGDGAVVVRDRLGKLYAVTLPPEAEYANETTFITSGEGMMQAQKAIWQGPIANLALFSDGLQRLAITLTDGQPYGPFFAPLFRFAQEEALSEAEAIEALGKFLASPRITSRADDDLTLLLATYIPENSGSG